MWVAGWTEGGAPYGLSYEEWRRGQREGEGRAGWAQSLTVLEELARLQSDQGTAIDVGRVVKVGDGLSRDAFAAELTLRPDPDGISGKYVVLLPRANNQPERNERARRELRLLAALQDKPLPFRVPRPLGALPAYHGVALVTSFIRGVQLDLRAGRQPSVRPWKVVGEIAAGVHGVDVASLPDLAGHPTRRDHALAQLAVFDELEHPEVRAARSWALEHLPPAEPASLVHGDLLGQNILLDPSEQRPFGVIDWEHATIGDPAYDLAIVTRGVRQPFQIAGGLDRLLDAYAAAGGAGVTRDHVRVHELAMAALWYREALARPRGEGHPPEEALAHMRRLLRLAQG